MTELTLHTHAKINLYLDIGNRREDGFHNIETIFQTLDLHDELTFASAEHSIDITCNDPTLDTGPGNLIHRAATLLREHTATSPGAKITLTKNIPIAAGLAGGSGNAAATLIALDKLWNLRCSRDDLNALALRLGSDVPYCLTGGTAAAQGRGEKIKTLPQVTEPTFILVHPEIQVSTAAVYADPDLRRTPMTAEKSEPFQQAIRACELRDWPNGLHNTMETVVFNQHPALREIKQKLLEAGCSAAIMSGSGPTIFGIAPSAAHAQKIADALRPLKTTIAKPVSDGLRQVR